MVYFFLFETKALSLENVDAMYSDRSLKAWQSKNWVPEGYVDRNTRDGEYWQRRASVGQQAGGGVSPAKPHSYSSDEKVEESAPKV